MLNRFLLLGAICAVASSSFAFTLSGTDPNLKGWNTNELTFTVNYSGCSVSQTVLNGAIDDAIGLWNSVESSHIKLKRGGATSTSPASAWALINSDGPSIVCDTSFGSTTSQNANAVVGLARNGTINGRIAVANIVMNSQAGGSANINNVSSIQLSIAIAHEMGHVLGLGHSDIPAALMYYSLGSKNQLELNQDDIDGITFLYGQDASNSKMFGCGTIATAGAAGGGPGPGAWILAGWLMMAWGVTRGRRMAYIGIRN